jgi:tetratricopeptide (TPR) repeat protein
MAVEKIYNLSRILTLLGMCLSVILLTNLTVEATQQEGLGAEQSEAELFDTGFKFHMSGELEKAIHFYKLSIKKKPTAKAHTFLGWALSHQGKLDEAIAECRKAIEIDPEYGNPYNDIGAYYIEKEMYDEAIPFLEKATKAKNYEHYEFPHFNLGKVYTLKGLYYEAVVEFREALDINPDFFPAKIYLELLYHYVLTDV